MKITLRQWIEKCISFKYISNFSIIIGILAYYTNLYSIFFILASLIITNCIVIIILEFYNFDELFNKIVIYCGDGNGDGDGDGNSDGNCDGDGGIKMQFMILNTLWHVLPVIWLYYILNKDRLISVFKPNFIAVFFQAVILSLIYFYFGSTNKIYGNINYLGYLILYYIILLAVCCNLYLIK